MKQTIELHKKWKADPSKGEVFTPSELVREMLDKIPTSVWENPNSMFLDPCMGKGTFLIEIVTRLINIYGYSKEDAISRVYGYDTCVKYVNHLKRGGLVNVFHKDFLSEELNMKFDVVVGNPPYQNSKESGSESLWIKFVKKAYELSDVVCLVTPKTWCNLTKDSYDKQLFNIFKNHLEYVNLSNNLNKKYFQGVASTFSYYVINKNKKNKDFLVEQDGNQFILNYDTIQWIPDNLSQVTLDILKKTLWSEKEKINGQFNEITGYRKGGKFIDEDGLYKVSNTSAQYSKDMWLYTNTPQNIMNQPKVIYSDSGYNKPYYDNGLFNLGHHSKAFFVKDETEAKNLITFLNSKIVKFFIKTMVPTGKSIGFEKIAKYIPKDFLDFNLSKDELFFLDNEK